MSLVKDYPLTTTAAIGSLALYLATGMNVSRLRMKYGIKSPDCGTGNHDFECGMRIQQNTLEHVVVAVPAMMMISSASKCDHLGASVGGVWILGRLAYWIGFPDKRGAGFAVGGLATLGGLAGALYYTWKK